MKQSFDLCETHVQTINLSLGIFNASLSNGDSIVYVLYKIDIIKFSFVSIIYILYISYIFIAVVNSLTNIAVNRYRKTSCTMTTSPLPSLWQYLQSTLLPFRIRSYDWKYNKSIDGRMVHLKSHSPEWISNSQAWGGSSGGYTSTTQLIPWIQKGIFKYKWSITIQPISLRKSTFNRSTIPLNSAKTGCATQSIENIIKM